MKRALLHPRHPDRICWGCDTYCRADDLACGNGTIRTPHPSELFGDNWLDDLPLEERRRLLGVVASVPPDGDTGP
jgi:Protein of unknown function (DUF3079)